MGRSGPYPDALTLYSAEWTIDGSNAKPSGRRLDPTKELWAAAPQPPRPPRRGPRERAGRPLWGGRGAARQNTAKARKVWRTNRGAPPTVPGFVPLPPSSPRTSPADDRIVWRSQRARWERWLSVPPTSALPVAELGVSVAAPPRESPPAGRWRISAGRTRGSGAPPC